MGVYLLSSPFTYLPGVSASGNGSNHDNAIDYRLDSYWGYTAAGTPQLTFDLGEARTIDSVWFKSENVDDFQLQYSTNNSTWNNAFSTQEGNDDGYNFNIEFDEQTARYWRIRITDRVSDTEETRLYDVKLMKLMREFDANSERPIEVIPTTDDNSEAYRTGDGDLIVDDGLSVAGKTYIRMSWSFLPDTIVDELEEIWLGPPRKPYLTIFPRSDDFPNRIFLVKWDAPFEFSYTTEDTSGGQSGTIDFLEI